MFTHELLLWCVDSPLEKADVSQQTLMERFVEGIEKEKRETIYGSDEMPAPLHEWRGISLNDFDEIAEINWGYRLSICMNHVRLEGTLIWRWMPETIEKIMLTRNDHHGTIDIASFSRKMRIAQLNLNTFIGEIDLTRLPPNMEKLDVSENQLEGSVDLTRLPETMRSLYLQVNKLSGQTDFSELPKSLKAMFLNGTDLSGEIIYNQDMRLVVGENSKVKVYPKYYILQGISLRQVFENIHLEAFEEDRLGRPPSEICEWPIFHSSSFLVSCYKGVLDCFQIREWIGIGNFNLGFFPNEVSTLSVVSCQQKSRIETRHFPRKGKSIDLSDNFLYGCPDFAALPSPLSTLNLAMNRLNGSISFCSLPKGIRSIYIGKNAFQQKSVFYGDLPERLWIVDLNGNNIRTAKSLTGEDMQNRRVFVGMKR